MSEAGYMIKLKLNQGKRKNEILINKNWVYEVSVSVSVTIVFGYLKIVRSKDSSNNCIINPIYIIIILYNF